MVGEEVKVESLTSSPTIKSYDRPTHKSKNILQVVLIVKLPGDAVEQYICGSAGCSINAFIHRSTDLVSSKDAFMCAETVSLS